MGWRSGVDYTNKSVGRIDQAAKDKTAKRERGMATVMQAVSLFDTYMTDKREFNDLSGYAEEQGLTWDKKSKTFGGQHDSGMYSINQADLSAIRDKTKFGEYDFEGITTKGGKIKSNWGTLRPEAPVVEHDIDDSELMTSTPTTIGRFDNLDDWDDDMADSSWQSGGERISAHDIQKRQMKSLSNFVQDEESMGQYGQQLYKEGAGLSQASGEWLGSGGDIAQTRDIMAKYATPQDLGPAKTTVTNTYGDRESGEYFVDEEKNLSTLDKFKDFIDVTDTNEGRADEKKLSQYRGNMEAVTQGESWQEKMGLYTGQGKEGYRSTSWEPTDSWLKDFSDQTKTYSNTQIPGIPEWRLDKSTKESF